MSLFGVPRPFSARIACAKSSPLTGQVEKRQDSAAEVASEGRLNRDYYNVMLALSLNSY